MLIYFELWIGGHLPAFKRHSALGHVHADFRATEAFIYMVLKCICAFLPLKLVLKAEGIILKLRW